MEGQRLYLVSQVKWRVEKPETVFSQTIQVKRWKAKDFILVIMMMMIMIILDL